MSPRFTVSSPEALILESAVARPPVQTGDRAELQLPGRNVHLVCSVVDFEVVWREVVDEAVF